MPATSSQSAAPFLPVALALAAGAATLAVAPPRMAFLVVAAIVVFLIAFFNPEVAIHLIILSMLLSPEAQMGGGELQIGKAGRKGAQAVFRLEDLLLVVVGLSWFARTALKKELGLLVRTPLNKPIAAYVVAIVLATAVGVFSGTVNPKPGFFYTLKYVEYFVLYFMAVNILRDERQLRRLLFTAFATCAIASVIGILQIPSGERVSAPFEGKYGEPNTFGGYLLFMLALTLALWLQSRNNPAFFGWLGMAALILIPLLYTLSRSSYVGAVPMVLTLFALTDRKAWIAIPLAVVAIGGPLVFPKQVQERIAFTFTQPATEGQMQIGKTRFDTSTSARFVSFRQGLEGWGRRPLLGYGVTGFAFMDAQYVRTLVETGVIGFSAFLWLVAVLLRSARTSLQAMKDPFSRALAMGYLAGLLGLLTHAIGANTFIIVRIMEPFWFFTAIVVMLPRLAPAPSASARAAPPSVGQIPVLPARVSRTP